MEEVVPESVPDAAAGAEAETRGLDLPPEVIDQLVETLADPSPVNLQADPLFATPNDAYGLFLELVRQHIPLDKQQMLIRARGKGDTLESALSVDFVLSLAMAELRGAFGTRVPPQ
jgi:hypothetical protein